MKWLPFLGALLLSGPVLASSRSGEVQVVVTDEHGQNISDAVIYIEGQSSGHFTGGLSQSTMSLYALAPGRYRVTSTRSNDSDGMVRRWSSHEAWVDVREGERETVMLQLHPLEDPLVRIIQADLRRRGFNPNN